MGEVRKLYEERKMTELIKVCQQSIDDGTADFDVYACMAYAQAARNDFSRVSLEEAMPMYEKAAVLCEGDSDKKKELFETFVKEIESSVERTSSKLEALTLTEDVIVSVRESMRFSAEALMEAVEKAEGLDTLSAKKLAVACMVKVCAPYNYEQNLGKVAVKKVSNASDELRDTYVGKYDALVADIKAEDDSYVPEEIQREALTGEARQEAKAQQETENADGKKKKSLIDRLLDFF